MRSNSNTWKSLVDGSPFWPRSDGSWRSRSSKNRAVARTIRRASVTASGDPAARMGGASVGWDPCCGTPAPPPTGQLTPRAEDPSPGRGGQHPARRGRSAAVVGTWAGALPPARLGQDRGRTEQEQRSDALGG